jgi:hypothetical protein
LGPELTPARVSKLENLIDWEWDPIEADWNLNLQALRNAATKFGGFLQIPGGYIDDDGNRVYQWTNSLLSTQRFGKIPEDKRKQLEAIPGFSTNRREAAWNWGLVAARNWLTSSTEMPANSLLVKETNNSLRNWLVVALRTVKLANPNEIELKRIALIQALPNWEKFASRGIGKVRTFKLFACDGNCVKHGKALKSPSRCKSIDLSYSDSELSSLRPASIRTIAEYLSGLEQYSSKFGNCIHPITENRKIYKYKDYALGSVKNGYRNRRDKIEPELASLLEKIPGWVWVDDDNRWNESFSLLERYSKEFGTSSVKQGVTFHGYELGNWVARQRRRYKGANNRASITDSEKQRLEALPGWSWDASQNRSTDSRDKAWEASFTALKKFVDREKTLKIPPKHQENGIFIARWVAKQRQLYKGSAKAGLIRPEEIKRLESINGWKW